MLYSNIRFGLCCTFRDEPIRFRRALAVHASRDTRAEMLEKLAATCAANAAALQAALEYCAAHAIGCFRINSQILPLKTHPALGYEVNELPGGDDIIRSFARCGQFAKKHGLRTCFHPDQFVVLNSPRPDVVEASLREIEYQAEIAEWVGADVINVHAGGAYGDKSSALREFSRNLNRLTNRARTKLTVENDDRTYTPADLLDFCRSENLPLVYDVHHHRCNRDELAIEDATERALTTWNREPLFHISSPLNGWGQVYPERHHDFINVRDVPTCWHDKRLTVEVEAKAKEIAVLKLMRGVRKKRIVING